MRLEVFTEGLLEKQTDCLVVGLTEDRAEQGDLFSQLDQSLDGYLSAGIANGQFSAKKKEVAIIHTLGKLAAKCVMLVGLGRHEKVDFAFVRELSAGIANEAVKGNCKDIVVSFPHALETILSPFQTGHAFAEGLTLASYKFEGYHLEREEHKVLDYALLAGTKVNRDELAEGLKTGTAFAKGTNLARDFVNMPANYLTPTVFAKAAVEIAERYGMEVEVLERADMEKLGMGALLGVAQGSANPPKMVIIKYQGCEKWENVISFVGKGITFDTGGISLKPAAGMESMVMDMGGAAAVIGAMDTIGRIKPKVNILAVVPMVENMPDGAAYRPGDVLTSMSGRTIEVISTDAEGRLILADAITYAKKLGVSCIVDLATLTGAVLIALGTQTTGAMTNNKDWVNQVLQAADESGELMWELPTFDVYREQNKSRIADLKNTGGRYAGTITAGMFLGEFAEDTPWVHLDIAGTAWQEKGSDLNPVGATGVMVRTLSRIALNNQ
ncbi:leucyl aminopeptidase [Paenibacillus sp.]|jgi:leucyl aminopeptidase|uniref:leucyl aminopeptidase n=1 Tax=Paenibacillus sp. TaxID=58172 RepID=UPI00282DCF9B|nr:leucyl aminopeptidase [Paenibacillus sp.]MDR0267213.1 leucyl aminopeptidase [Paenibacillus sp.]